MRRHAGPAPSNQTATPFVRRTRPLPAVALRILGGLVAGGGLMALTACQATPTILPSRNFSRPSDMAFVCMGLFTPATGADGTPLPGGYTGRPMTECHLQGTIDRPAAPARETYAFVANTERNELAVVDLAAARLVDLEPSIPGYNHLPVGERPESIASSADGCRLATANRGSCDISFVDPSAALRNVAHGLNAKVPLPGPEGAVTRVVPHTASGVPLGSAPGEIVFLPGEEQTLADLERMQNTCSPLGQWVPPPAAGGPPGRHPWRALVTFPACDLVATIDMPSGLVTSSVRITADGAVDMGVEPTCPIECGGGTGAPPDAADAEPGDAAAGNEDADGADGGLVDPPLPDRLEVSALALVPKATRVYVGARRAPFVTAIDLVDDRLMLSAGGPGSGRIRLHEGALGVTRLRLSVDPFGAAPGRGVFVGHRGQFLYAFARDGSVRVVEIPVGGTDPGRECDTQVDPLGLGSAGLLASSCFAFEDPANPLPRRRPLALGPGIRLPSSTPIDVAFASLFKADQPISDDATLDGAFGFLITTNGAVYVVNLDPTPRLSEAAPPMTHSFRDANVQPFANVTAGTGPARIDIAPVRAQVDSRVPLTADLGPRLEGVPLSDPFDNPRASDAAKAPTWALFPDKTAVLGGSWSVGWEAPLAGSSRYSGKLRDGPTAALDDEGGDFCHLGVVAGDAVQMLGCRQDSDCGFAETCVQSPEAPLTVTGLCLPKASIAAGLPEHCRAHLITNRRYTIVTASATHLALEPRIDEFPRPTGFACSQDEDCRQMHDKDRGAFRCVAVRPGEAARCVQPCDPAVMKCRPGTTCEAYPGSNDGHYCAEAPAMDTACYPMLSHYNVQAGHAFMVSGSSLPGFDTAREEGGRCVPWDDPVQTTLRARIPIAAPACSNVPDGTPSEVAIKITPSPNPCSYVAPNSDVDPAQAQPGKNAPAKVLFQNPQMRVIMTNLDTAFGDLMEIRFDVHGGFLHTGVQHSFDLNLALPARIVTGPTVALQRGDDATGYVNYPYLYALDQGRLSAAASHGRLLRIRTSTPVTFDDLRSVPPFLLE